MDFGEALQSMKDGAKVEYGNTKPIKLGKSFSGTFVHWELNFNNNNIEYSI